MYDASGDTIWHMTVIKLDTWDTKKPTDTWFITNVTNMYRLVIICPIMANDVDFCEPDWKVMRINVF